MHKQDSQIKPKLYIFAISHFSEKARFVLDHCNFSYETVFLTPGEHINVVKEFANDSFVPILRGENYLFQGSNPIIEFLRDSNNLKSNDFKSEMEIINKIDSAIGYPLQPIVYSYLLEEPSIVARMFASSPNQLAEFDNFKLIALGLKRRYKITTSNIAEQKYLFMKGVDFLSKSYEDSSFLAGNNFSIADITAASLISPLFFPPEHPNSEWFQGITFPEKMQEWLQPLKDTKYYQRVMEIYKQFR